LDAVVNGDTFHVTPSASYDESYMAHALALAAQGFGCVEPNPVVGCVLVRDGEIVGHGFHERFGGPHAEINALAAAGELAAGATAYVTLEPCCHVGKTPPCTKALIAAGIARVVVATQDPYLEVDGQGIAELRAAGIQCDVGLHRAAANWLLAPYRKLVSTGRPWLVAKWAMTLDGKLATRSGDSQWISSEASRSLVHQIRGRADGIMVGSGTAQADNPLLTARPANRADLKRVATRIVVDSGASLSPNCRLAQTAADVPVLVAVAADAPADACRRLTDTGIEVVQFAGATHCDRIDALLVELGRRCMTNVLVEGGSRLLGTLFDLRSIDEAHVFVAPKLAGGESALSPVAGTGVDRMAAALKLADVSINELEGDVHIHGRF
jgi:diaminohydroxyphosphoribosylaminopyrimidine deaminase / 5-amino-6-(5-phosphoribosylamino)uracil reductase